ncbi:MAG: hypothetical protein H7199_10285 [Burkholderiales bacterium]|nr:hypothetical protein [Flavobacterium sp.]
MKTKIITPALFAFLFFLPLFAQDRTFVNATSSEISDNLDLRAVASIFGEAKNIEDFERKLNDPEIQISNLDLNNDNRVDYLRVIESVEGYTHLIIVQSVLGQNNFQDVATIEVERDRYNQVQIQVVGDVYMYGHNYIYEPAYVQTPIIYNSFWVNSYIPYCSAWYYNYYPIYYYSWNTYPVFRYRNNVDIYINFYNHYDYVSVRRSERAIALHTIRRSNYCERQYPSRSFAYRNNNVSNRYELDKTRNLQTGAPRDEMAFNNTRTNATAIKENNTPRTDNDVRTNFNSVRENNTPRTDNDVRTNFNSVRENNTPRIDNNVRTNFNSVRENNTPRTDINVRTNFSSVRENNTPRTDINVRTNFSSIRESSTPRIDNNVRTSFNSVLENNTPRTTGRARTSSNYPRENRITSFENIAKMNLSNRSSNIPSRDNSHSTRQFALSNHEMQSAFARQNESQDNRASRENNQQLAERR